MTNKQEFVDTDSEDDKHNVGVASGVASFFAVVCAVATRLVFGVHSVVVVWRTTDAKGSQYYWLLLCALLLLLVETVYTLIKRKGREWAWFCPSFFFYLLATLPGIWLLELNRLERYHLAQNGTKTDYAVTLSSISVIDLQIPLIMSEDTWVLVLEQSLLFLLIIGRWLLPKGNITHDQLSQLLLVYIGISSDIMEILVLFDEPKVLNEPVLHFCILGSFSISLFQYTLVLTATKARKRRVVHSLHNDEEEEAKIEEAAVQNPSELIPSESITVTCEKVPVQDSALDVSYSTEKSPGNLTAWQAKQKPQKKVKTKVKDVDRCSCCRTEIWSLLLTISMQDGPFLAIRLYVMIAMGVLNYTIIFYTFKNVLVILLQLYRMVAVASHVNRKRLERRSIRRSRKANQKDPSNMSTLTVGSEWSHL